MKKLKIAVLPKDGIGKEVDGSASTQTMADAIIDGCTHPKTIKTLSFLATGSEIIQGEVQDSNSHQFAKIINSRGGNIYQHIQVSDNKIEIMDALRYLLSKSDAVLITGGLGPTSDDRTRYALAEVTKHALYFDETAWKHVVARLKNFNLSVADSNRQQALFPEGSELYPNENGTAFGAYLRWNNKHIFMLPGPPRECLPMFKKYVIPTLDSLDFYVDKKTYKWLTLGLIEGEITQKVDETIKLSKLESGYRWNYPYLEIKLTSFCPSQDENLIQDIDNMLLPHTVSRDGKNSMELLLENLKVLKGNIYIVNEITKNNFFSNMDVDNLVFLEKKQIENFEGVVFQVSSLPPLYDNDNFTGSVTFECRAYVGNELKYQHKIITPCRGPEVIEYVKAYIAWQICQFMELHKEYF